MACAAATILARPATAITPCRFHRRLSMRGRRGPTPSSVRGVTYACSEAVRRLYIAAMALFTPAPRPITSWNADSCTCTPRPSERGGKGRQGARHARATKITVLTTMTAPPAAPASYVEKSGACASSRAGFGHALRRMHRRQAATALVASGPNRLRSVSILASGASVRAIEILTAPLPAVSRSKAQRCKAISIAKLRSSFQI